MVQDAQVSLNRFVSAKLAAFSNLDVDILLGIHGKEDVEQYQPSISQTLAEALETPDNMPYSYTH